MISKKYLGAFKTAEDAARAYDTEFKKLYPEAYSYSSNEGLGLLPIKPTGCIKITAKSGYEYLLEKK